MNKRFSNVRTTIQLTVVAVFLLATTLTAALAIGLQYHFGQSMAREAATHLYTAASSSITAELASIGRVNDNVIDLLADNTSLVDTDTENAHLAIFTKVLHKNPLYYGIYLGGGDGTFFEVINLNSSDNARQVLRALPTDRWVIVSVRKTELGSERQYQYLDEKLLPRLTRSERTEYDVRQRPWYQSAMGSNTVQKSAPYIFAQAGVPGRTISKRIPGTETVVAIDMTLSSVSGFLSQHAVAKHGDLYPYSSDGQVIASSTGDSYTRPGPPAPELVLTEEQQHKDLVETWRTPDRLEDNNKPNTVPSDTLIQIAANPALHGQLVETSLAGETFLAYAAPTSTSENPLYAGILAPLDTVVAPFLSKLKLSIAITAAFLLFLLPLAWVFANPIVRPIRQLAAENEKVQRREYSAVQLIPSRVKELDDLSGSMVSMVASIQAHELAQRALMDSFIQLIAQAIDDKSAYTGGHCERVPELALMLAEQASNSTLPAFRDFRLETDDQWREYRIAAWLHDCGKITTPEHIVDKGSKLETIYNRIHEVRMRFEVLWREAQLDYWQQLQETPGEELRLAEVLKQKQAQLKDDFAFVAECNVGGEFLDQDKLDRLQDIAKITWQRQFDDRIGLSPLEELRTPPIDQVYPVNEALLSDKPEHILQRTRSTDYPAEFGINMDIPVHLYNQGEIYNLSISRGTLTTEDRFKINEHMISTIKMLESLHFPEELKNVPRYASTHHETMRGSGYPRKLSGDQLSVPERILAVADVFEALTASDRPYKKAKPVSVAVDILHKMVLDNHLDKECFELFVRDKVYLQYARQYLPESQLDVVDESKYLGG